MNVPTFASLGSGGVSVHVCFNSQYGRDRFLKHWPAILKELQYFAQLNEPRHPEMSTPNTERLPFVAPWLRCTMHQLMTLACNACKTHPAEIFRVACLHTHQNFDAKEMRLEYKIQTEQGFWEAWVLDTCLDILAQRIPVRVFEAEAGWVWIIRPLNVLPTAEQWVPTKTC